MNREWLAGRLALVLAGLALVVAPILPFLTATAVFVGTISRSGVDYVGPEAFLLSAAGAVLIYTGWQRAGGVYVARPLPLVASLIAGGLTVWYYQQISERIREVAGTEFGVASIGLGLWLAIGGSIVGVLISLLPPQEVSPAEAAAEGTSQPSPPDDQRDAS
jgi:hypothetical protein